MVHYAGLFQVEDTNILTGSNNTLKKTKGKVMTVQILLFEDIFDLIRKCLPWSSSSNISLHAGSMDRSVNILDIKNSSIYIDNSLEI